MNKIIVGFSKPIKWKPFSWLIMAAYGIPYDHVYIRFHSDKYDRDLIYQASGLAVNFMGSTIFNSIAVTIKEFSVDLEDGETIPFMRFCIDNAGKPYGLMDVLGLAWVRICAFFGKKVNNPVNDGQNSWVCSEIAAFILKNFAGANITETIDQVTPLDLFNYLSANQG